MNLNFKPAKQKKIQPVSKAEPTKSDPLNSFVEYKTEEVSKQLLELQKLLAQKIMPEDKKNFLRRLTWFEDEIEHLACLLRAAGKRASA